MFNKNFVFEKIIYLVILAGVIAGFCYFEENVFLKITAILMTLIGSVSAFSHKPNQITSKFELLNLILLYLGFFSVYNLLYGINLPVYIAMMLILALVISISYLTFIIDGVNKLLSRDILYIFILLTSLTVIELFLSLYFWPVDPGIKSLVLTIAYFQVSTFIYLYARSMLRLSKISGYLVVNILALAMIFLSIWIQLPK